MLGRDGDGAHWTAAAERLGAAMLKHLWTGERFAARSATTGHTWTSDSLLDVMAIVLGDELPAELRDTLAERVRSHLTAGHTDLADDISARFRMLGERPGFAKNFDAHTGAGLRDRAYTWGQPAPT